MDKLYVVLSTIFIHILFLLVEGGLIISVYCAAVDHDRSLLILTGLFVLARQCLKGMWHFQRLEWLKNESLKTGTDGISAVVKRVRRNNHGS